MEKEKNFIDINSLASLKGENYLIIKEYPELDYTLMYRFTSYEPWVLAWQLDRERKCWSQGHYFKSLAKAIDFVWSKSGRIPYMRMEEIASRALDMIDEQDWLEYLNEDLDLTEKELEYFGKEL